MIYRLLEVWPCGRSAGLKVVFNQCPVHMTTKRTMWSGVAVAAATLWTPLGTVDAQTAEGTLPPVQAALEKDASAAPKLEGLWPSPKLMELMLARWADRISLEYELDDVQRVKVREAVTGRWSSFLKDNRPAIQPVFNELLEMRLELEPPTKERVEAWAGRAMPVFEKFRKQLNQGTAEFRDVLTPLQRAKFKVDELQFGVGLSLAEQKLKQWQKGEFDEGDFWERPTTDRRKGRAERRRRRAAKLEGATGLGLRGAPAGPRPVGPQDQIALEIAAWDKYVKEFIRTYGLGEGQRDAVLSVLSELKDRAIAHRDRRRDDITKLEQRIETFSGTDEEPAKLKMQLTELYGPIDQMFQELKRRIEQVPTAAQRAEAVKNAK